MSVAKWLKVMFTFVIGLVTKLVLTVYNYMSGMKLT